MKHPARPAQRGIHVVGTQARNVQNNGPHLCTYHAALKSQELEENVSIAYDISNTRYQLPCPSRASRRWLVVLALTLHVFHAATNLFHRNFYVEEIVFDFIDPFTDLFAIILTSAFHRR